MVLSLLPLAILFSSICIAEKIESLCQFKVWVQLPVIKSQILIDLSCPADIILSKSNTLIDIRLPKSVFIVLEILNLVSTLCL